MGRRGPHPKPTNLIVLEGRKPSHRAVPVEREARPVARIPDPPREIVANAEALAEWKRAGADLYALGLISNIDQAVFAAYCFAHARYMAAERVVASEARRDARRRGRKKLGAEGLMIRTISGNIIQNPAVGIANKAAAAMLRYAVELGLTPSARTRINPTPSEGADDDEFVD